MIPRCSSQSVGCHPSEGNRIVINISKYAEINVPQAWPGNRNPVTYTSLDELGIGLANLA